MNLYNENSLETFKRFEDKSLNTIFSDPPYNLGSEIFIDKDGKPKFSKNTDFMSKWKFGTEEWEKFFDESFRVLKYGGYCVLFSLNRQNDLISYYARKSGFVRCQTLYWYFVSNFPKASDISKHIDKAKGLDREVVGINKNGINSDSGSGCYNMNNENSNMLKEFAISTPACELSQIYSGFKGGIAPLKETCEEILVFRKPLKTGTLAGDVIALHENGDNEISPACVDIDGNKVGVERIKTNGRYPATTFISSEAGEIIDEQSGELAKGDGKIRTGANRKNNTVNGYKSNNDCYGAFNKEGLNGIDNYGDSGGAPRILHTCDYDEGEYNLYNYCPKVNPAEREAGCGEFEEILTAAGNGANSAINRGLDSYDKSQTIGLQVIKKQQNSHPTLKPIKLIMQISKLFKLPPEAEQKVFIPFAGAGSELIGFLKAGYNMENVTASEISEEYYEFLKARFDFWNYRKKHNITSKVKKMTEEYISQTDLFKQFL